MIVALLIGALLAGVAGTAVIATGSRRWNRATTGLLERIAANRQSSGSLPFSTTEIRDLPKPVQRYFRTALNEGQRMVTRLTLEQTGTFNLNERSPRWRPFTAQQQVEVCRPGFIWDARILMFPGISVRVRDAYAAGEGSLKASVFGVVPVADLQGGGDLAAGELMRFLAEAPWYPTALLPSRSVAWSAVDDHSANATLQDGGISVTLLFHFNELDGLIDSVHALARVRTSGTETVSMPWQCRLWNYTTRDGMRVPQEGEAAWIHPTGSKPYWLGRVTLFRYRFSS